MYIYIYILHICVCKNAYDTHVQYIYIYKIFYVKMIVNFLKIFLKSQFPFFLL